MPNWLRIALIILCALALWWLATTLGRGVAKQSPPGTGMTRPAAESRLAT